MRHSVKKLVYSAMCLALCLVLPFLTGQIPEVGAMLLPMHLPVLLCGFLCGGPWGALVGFIAPLMRSVLTGGFPPMFPTALAMAFELAGYGLAVGLVWPRVRHNGVAGVYMALLPAMVFGRLVWGAAQFVLLGLGGTGFTLQLFLAGAVLNAVPGIALQLVLVPVLVSALNRARVTA